MLILVVTSKFNYQITHSLHKGCVDTLLASQRVFPAEIKSLWVPGAFEIPMTVTKALHRKNYDVVICLGAIVRGETYHFDLLAKEVTRALMQISVERQTPVIFEVLATENIEQALARCGLTGSKKNKGVEAAEAALAMVEVVKGMEQEDES